ncbi:MAG TPA: hypothetical protein VGK56_04750 [Anaerolineales bacterium]
MDIYEMLLLGGDPVQQQLAQAQALRSKKALNDAMQSSSRDSRQMEMLNFAATAAGNNPSLAAATQAMSRSAAGRRPQALGQSSIIVGDQLYENPEYVETKGAERQGRLLQAAAALAGKREAADLRRQTAIEAEQGRMERAEMMSTLRREIAGGQAATKAEKEAAKREAAAAGKTLPAGQAVKIGQAEGVRDSYNELVSSFMDEYSGTPVAAPLQNTLGKFGIDKYRNQSNWWQNYTEQSNKVRHELFGSALTANEQKAFEAATIVPGMDPKEIRRRLGQQARAAALAHQKQVQALGKAGYNVGNFDTLVPEDVPPPGGSPAKPKRIKLDVQGNVIP